MHAHACFHYCTLHFIFLDGLQCLCGELTEPADGGPSYTSVASCLAVGFGSSDDDDASSNNDNKSGLISGSSSSSSPLFPLGDGGLSVTTCETDGYCFKSLHRDTKGTLTTTFR